MKKKILLGLLLLFVVVQAIQPSRNMGAAAGPDAIEKAIPVPDHVLSILQRSCYDCHSNHTAYPWYDNITPVNWWVAHHVKEGKEELNFTIFNTYTNSQKGKKLEEIAESVEEGEMPLRSYLFMHKNAKLTSEQRKLVAGWAKAERAKYPGAEE